MQTGLKTKQFFLFTFQRDICWRYFLDNFLSTLHIGDDTFICVLKITVMCYWHDLRVMIVDFSFYNVLESS